VAEDRYRITFSSNEIDLTGKSMAEIKMDSLKSLKIQNETISVENRKSDIELVKLLDLLQSKRTMEKQLLYALIATAQIKATKPSEMNCLGDIEQTIKDADDYFDIRIDEWKTYFIDQYEQFVKNASDHRFNKEGQDIFPYWIRNIKEITKQLYAPALVPAVVEKEQ